MSRLLGGDPVRDRLLGVERAEPDLHQRVRAHDVRRGALDHRDVGAHLPQRRADVVGGVVGADHDAPLARVRVGAGVLGRVVLVALEVVHAGDVGHVRLAGHAGRHHELLRPQRDRLAVALDVQRPLAGVGVVRGALGLGAGPVVELHHPRVHLQPVADLVLGREHRPVLRELDVRQVVVPDRVVQAQRLVAVAPAVAGPLAALDDDRRHAELAQARAERDPALAAADDHDLGLDLVAELLGLLLALLEPRLAVRSAPCSTPFGRPGPGRLLVALELVQRGQQRPRLAVAQPQQPAAAADRGLEADPRRRDAVGGVRRLGRVPVARLRVPEREVEHVADLVRALDGLDVPRERDQVAPERLVVEQRGGGFAVARGQGVVELGQPLIGFGHGLSSLGRPRTLSRSDVRVDVDVVLHGATVRS